MRIKVLAMFAMAFLSLVTGSPGQAQQTQKLSYAAVKVSGGLDGRVEFSCITGADFYSSVDKKIGRMSKEEREELSKLARALVESKPEKMYGTGGFDKFSRAFQITLGTGDQHVDFNITVHQGATNVPKELEAYSKKYFELMQLTRNRRD